MAKEFTSLLASVPNVVWSAIIASFLTFLGVMWTNRGSSQRQRELLSHETDKFRFEQSIALKKEVFLEAAASFSRVLTIFPRLLDLTFSEKELMELMSNHGPIISKTYLVAKEETVSKLLDISNDISETYLSLLMPRAQLLDYKKAIEIYENMINQAEAEKGRLISIMKEFNLQGRTDKATFDYLQSSYESQDQTVLDSRNKIEEHKKELKPKHKEFIKKCISEYARLSIAITPTIIAVRKELDNDSDSGLFVSAMNQSMARMEASFEKLLSEQGE